MKNYGNIHFNRRVVSLVCMLVVAVSVLMSTQVVSASAVTKSANLTLSCYLRGDDVDNKTKASLYDNGVMTGFSPIYSFVIYPSTPYRSTPAGSSSEYDTYDFIMGYCSASSFSISGNNYWSLPNGEEPQSSPFPYDTTVSSSGIYNSSYCSLYGNYGTFTCYSVNPTKISSDIVIGCDSFRSGFDNNDMYEALGKLQDYVLNGVVSDGMIFNIGSTAVTNESIGYLQDCKLNLSYVTPIKGNSIFETTNHQIYTDMIYNLRWNGQKTTTDYDLSSSYVQLYAKAHYRKDEYEDFTTSDFIKLGDSVEASKGKVKFSFMELFEKSAKCKSAYLSDFPLSKLDHDNGKLQACSVTPNIKYEFFIRVYKEAEKGPWLCVSESGSHHSNEFVNSGVDVDYNVNSGDLGGDGSYNPDGVINESGTGVTGTGKDSDDAEADTNANDKIQSKKDSSSNTFDKLEEFVKGIGDVPKIIVDLFSFLPPWCLDVVGIAFALLMILLVVKFIRG